MLNLKILIIFLISSWSFDDDLSLGENIGSGLLWGYAFYPQNITRMYLRKCGLVHDYFRKLTEAACDERKNCQS